MYRRFLNKNDYLSIITDTALEQLIRGQEFRFSQAEQAAEATIIDYLSENYEVEAELNRGKYIFEYNRKVTYPIGTHFYLDGQIMKVIQAISGYKAPCLAPYWHEVEQVEDFDSVEIYSQMKTYYPGDMVNYLNTIYECDIQNGYEFNDIRIPGVIAWEMDEHARWAAISYDLWQIVQYEGLFYVLFDKNGYDYLENPADSDCWGQIGDYDPELNNYELNEREYVVYQNRVFHPVINPNSDVPQIDANIAISDPRNYNLKRHMTQLAMYELHKLISPNNISQVRVDDRDMTLQWLRDAGRLKINPQIPRKVDKDKKPITDWQMAAFQTEYNPYQNPWHI